MATVEKKVVKNASAPNRTGTRGSAKGTASITSRSVDDTLAGRVRLPYGPTSFTLGQLRKVVLDVKRKMA